MGKHAFVEEDDLEESIDFLGATILEHGTDLSRASEKSLSDVMQCAFPVDIVQCADFIRSRLTANATMNPQTVRTDMFSAHSTLDSAAPGAAERTTPRHQRRCKVNCCKRCGAHPRSAWSSVDARGASSMCSGHRARSSSLVALTAPSSLGHPRRV